MSEQTCSHKDSIKITQTDTNVCAKCVDAGDEWVHLRMCTECGNVACCDSSPNKHATKHFQETNHPIIQSIEKKETWKWCYIDEEYILE